MSKKIGALAFLSLALLACQDKEQSAEHSESKPITVGVTMSSIATNPFFQSAYQAYIDVANQIPNLQLLIDTADNNQDIQNQQINDFVAKGAGVVVVNLAQVSYGSYMVSDLCRRNIPVVFFNRSPGEANLSSCPTAYFVDGDAIEGGRLQGEQVIRAWERNPQWDKNGDGVIDYAMLQGIPGHEGAALRTQWSIAAIEFNPQKSYRTNQVFHDFGMFQQAKSQELVDAWITNEREKFDTVEVIMANNDTMALGAVEALKKHGLHVPVFGIDATQVGLKAWLDGDLAGTVFNDSETQAEISLKMASNLAANKPVMEGINYPLQNRVVKVRYQDVNQDNYRQYLKN
ncbi:MAG: galactose ABC transporter substrate-binding protein [Cardiobacteriaceae bacterium]|nr:galactose ABC transporter substrate-binding protein [Cardiobacteriaceae bacterium]